MIIDSHVHVGEDRDGEAQTIEALEASMRDSGIDHSIIFPFSGDRLIERSRELRERYGHQRNVTVLIRIDPSDTDREELNEVLDGFAGIKLHPNAQGFDIEDPAVAFVYEAAASRRLPVLFHTKASQPHSHPLKAIRVAQRYPELTVVLGHFFGDSFEAMELAPSVPNVYTETSIFGRSLRVKQLVESGYDRIMFGSDSPYDDQLAALLTVTRSGIDAPALANVLSGNASRLFGIDERAT